MIKSLSINKKNSAFSVQRLALICIFSIQLSAFSIQRTNAQCSICTKTAQQMGERPAKALNAGIVYLAILPLAIFGIIGYRWWKSNRE